ncbi:AraC family transcriptional regulator [Agromyces subbeticus]|uniref:AraC family transcriptional regulator n=1 Tax=Agromyces subbeticus TaxID=293890 RepID=UPI0003B4D214|nr:helix-turn-helix domain-containing protein [Agromyces subbeticus]
MTSLDERATPGRSIRTDERSGVLHPVNLERYGARWIDPDPAIAEVVDRYWHVRWELTTDEVIEQRIVTLPAVTLSIEHGDVPADLVITGAQSSVWSRRIAGRGEVFAMRLRPAGLAILTDLGAVSLIDQTLPVTLELDARLHALLEEIAAVDGADRRTAAANRVIADRLAQHALADDGRLANRVLDDVTARLRTRAGGALAERLGVSERAVQRALQRTIGLGPKRVARLVRLQEVARVLSSPGAPDLATLAVELGYTDQAHLHRDFRAVAGVTPGTYARAIRALS